MRLPLSFLFMIPVCLAIKCLIDFDINIAMIIGLFVALSLIIGGTLTLKYLMMFLAPLRKGWKGRSGTENTARMAIGYGPVDVDYSPLWTEVLTLSEDSAGQRLLRRVQSLEDEDLLHPGRQMLGAALAQFVSRLTGTPVDHPIEGLLTAAAFFDGMSLHGLWKTARNYSVNWLL